MCVQYEKISHKEISEICSGNEIVSLSSYFGWEMYDRK